MIIGTGIDLVDSRRIQKLLDTHGERFLNKYFTPHEIEHVQSLTEANQSLSLAKRFAAKEACAKALGCGFRDGIAMIQMEVGNNDQGKPIMTLSGNALDFLNTLIPDNKTAALHLSLTDEPPYAQAQLLIEAI